MIVGFTGTRDVQDSDKWAHWAILWWIDTLYARYGPTKFLHGDCVGWDEHFHSIAQSFGKVECMPSIVKRFRARTNAIVVRPPDRPLSRNRKIVKTSDIMLARPSTRKEGGTRYTMAYARELNKPLITFHPNKIVTVENLYES